MIRKQAEINNTEQTRLYEMVSFLEKYQTIKVDSKFFKNLYSLIKGNAMSNQVSSSKRHQTQRALDTNFAKFSRTDILYLM